MQTRLSVLLTSLLGVALLSGCPTESDPKQDDTGTTTTSYTTSGDDDDNATGDPGATLSSGLYTVRSTFFTDNNCGQSEYAFFPTALTLDVSGSNVTIVEFDASGTLENGEFEIGREYVESYLPYGQDCVLEIEVDLEGTVVADDTVDVVFEVYVGEAPLEPDADCESIATLELGFSTWNSLAGCRAEGTWTMER